MRTKLLAVLLLASAACGDDGSPATQRLDGGLNNTDPPEFAPEITSFRANPNTNIPAGTPTAIMWTWDYLIEPTYPEPTCTIDNGVGTVTNGQTTMVTLNMVTTFTLTCTNSQGTSVRQTVVSVPPVAPIISTFTVSPTTLATPNTSQMYTFTWSYTNVPSPAPTCYVDGASASPITSGTQLSLTLQQARTFHLRCINAAAASAAVADATVAVTECGTTSECNPNASCTDTVNGYNCTCAGGFTAAAWVNPPSTSTTNSAMGDTCYGQAASVGQCDTGNGAVYDAGTGTCRCPAGFVGSGLNGDCTRARIAFVTSVTGNGNFSTWANVTGSKGTEYADSICAYRAGINGANLPGTYKAWVSDTTDDAYCRIAGLSGKKSANCGNGGSLPASPGGPWVRTGDRRPFAPTLDKLAQRIKYYPAIYTESGGAVTNTLKVWTATDDAGVYTGNACNATWQDATSGFRGTTGLAYGGSSSWTKENNGVNTLDTTCNANAALLCLEVGAGNGVALPPRHPPSSKKAFLTSVSGNGALSTWPDAHGITGTYGYAQADEICRSRARYAGYLSANTFKAWFSPYPSSITSRLVNFLPYYRPDGVVLGTSYSDIADRQLNAGWDMTELNAYEQGNVDVGLAWTGDMNYNGSYYSSGSTYACSATSYTTGWTNGTNTYVGMLGKFGITDERYTGGGFSFSLTTGPCDTIARLYCVED